MNKPELLYAARYKDGRGWKGKSFNTTTERGRNLHKLSALMSSLSYPHFKRGQNWIDVGEDDLELVTYELVEVKRESLRDFVNARRKKKS